MKKDIRFCRYHGRFEADESNDWECPECGNELLAFSKFKKSGSINDAPLGLLERSGVITKKQKKDAEQQQSVGRLFG